MSKKIDDTRFISHRQFSDSIPGMCRGLRKLEFPPRSTKKARKALDRLRVLVATLQIMERFYEDMVPGGKSRG